MRTYLVATYFKSKRSSRTFYWLALLSNWGISCSIEFWFLNELSMSISWFSCDVMISIYCVSTLFVFKYVLWTRCFALYYTFLSPFSWFTSYLIYFATIFYYSTFPLFLVSPYLKSSFIGEIFGLILSLSLFVLLTSPYICS